MLGLYIFREFGANEGHRFIRGAQHEQTLAMVSSQFAVHVNADNDADERDLFQLRAEGEITRGGKCPTSVSQRSMSGLCANTPANFFSNVFSPSLVKKRLDIVSESLHGKRGCVNPPSHSGNGPISSETILFG